MWFALGPTIVKYAAFEQLDRMRPMRCHLAALTTLLAGRAIYGRFEITGSIAAMRSIPEHTKFLRRKRAATVVTDPPFNVRIDGHASGLGAIHHCEFLMASGEMTPGQYTGFLLTALMLLVLHGRPKGPRNFATVF